MSSKAGEDSELLRNLAEHIKKRIDPNDGFILLIADNKDGRMKYVSDLERENVIHHMKEWII
ncbi:MAG: hypothetical protein V3V88_03000, partial [Dehalococcoidia bacterium]